MSVPFTIAESEWSRIVIKNIIELNEKSITMEKVRVCGDTGV